MSYPTVQGRAVAGLTYREAQSCLGRTFAGSTYKFFLTGTSTPANVYQDGALTTPFPITGFVTADNFGRFPAIYLNPSIIYKVQFFNSANVQQWQLDPYVSQLSTVGTSSLSAFGITIAPTGEFNIPAPNTGGSGVSLTLNSGSLGITPLRISAQQRGNSALIINTSATTGAQAATFQANNKPGTPPVTFNVTATVAPSGATYGGGNLTANFTGTTGGNYTVQLSTGQDIFGVTFTNGSTTFVTPSTNISGTPTAALIVQTPVTPAAWLPITCDGVQYYTPIWHGSQPFVPLPGTPPAAQGESINAQSVLFGGSGLTTATGGTATPSNWLSPTSAGAGAGYYINITKTGGLSGLAFSAAQGAWTNIGAGGLNISSNAQAAISGTYQLSTSVTGSPVAASGTITLSGNNGVQSPTYNGAANLVLGGDGTATLNGAGSSNWFAPTTPNTGSGYWININQTGGTAGYTFSAASGAWTNITNGGLSIGISGTGSTSFNVTGTYTIASDSGGVNQLGTGTITLSGTSMPGSSVQSPNWSGTTPLKLNGNGSATLNGAGTSDWFSPNVANSGSGYWINITRTSGTAGVNFTAAQGSWTNITNSGLTIDMGGYTGDVGTVSVGGTWQISSSSSGTPVLGSGTISLSVNAGTVTRTYTSGTGATETVPTNASLLEIILDGAGASGGAGSGSTGGGGGGAGEAHSTAIAVSGGQTLTYTIGAAGAGVSSSAVTHTYTTAGSFTETIPTGATQVVIEVVGSSNGGGTGHAGTIGNAGGGGGGGSGGYCKTVLSLTSADWGKTLAVALATAPTASTISSGTKTITTMTANGGVIGASTSTNVGGAGGAGGTASGGNTTNTNGNAGASGAGGVETGGAGGAGIAGTNVTGPAGGHGQSTLSGGTLGSAAFTYTGSSDGNPSGASSVTGNGGLAGVSLSVGAAGAGLANGTAGAGSTASGGNSSNTNGGSGSGSTGGIAASGAAGGNPPSAPGGGSNGANNGTTSSGATGQLVFKYT